MVSCKSFWIVSIIFGFCSMLLFKNTQGGGPCGRENHNKSIGGLAPQTGSLTGQTCNWHIFPEKNKITETFIVFEEFELDPKDECTIGEHGGAVLFGPFSGNMKTFSVLAGHLNLDVSLTVENTPTPRKFKVHYSAEACDYYIDKEEGHMTSPFYQDVQRKYDVIACTWRFRDFKGVDLVYWITFHEFHLTNSTLHVKDDKSHETVYTGIDMPSQFAVPEKSVFEFHLNTKIPDEKFSFSYSVKGCYVPEVTTPSSDIGTTVAPVIINDIPLICGKNDYSEENGIISLGDTSHTTINFNCSWYINCENIPKAEEVHIQIEEFMLAKEDSVTIFDSSGNVLFGSYNGKREPFSVLTGVLKLKIQVDINQNQKFERKFKILYNAKDCSNQLTGDNGVVKLPVFKSGKSKSVTCSWVFNSPDKMSVWKVSFMQHKFDKELSLEGNIHPTDTYTQNNVPYVLARENGMIKLTFDTDAKTEFMFFYEKVLPTCSSFVELTKETLISSALKNNTFNFWANCFWIVESPKDSVIGIDVKKLNLIDLQDYVIVTDGNSKKSPLLSQMNSGNQNRTDEKQIISRGNSIVIFFQTQSVDVSEFEAKLSITKCKLFCNNGFCMLNNWKCNGINECGDYTDEKDCNGTIEILPSVKPPMKSETNDGNSGVSKLAIGLAVPAAFIGGMLMPIALAAGKQIIRNRMSASYGAFPIYNDP